MERDRPPGSLPAAFNDPYLVELLTILNRLAGSADEMGTFTKSLSALLTRQADIESENLKLINDKEEALKRAISQLQISQSQKKQLENQIAELRQSSNALAVGVPGSSTVLSGFVNAYTEHIKIKPGYTLFKRTCEACGKEFHGLTGIGAYGLLRNRCPECQTKSFGISVK